MTKSHKRIPYVLCPLIVSLAMAFPVHSEDNPYVYWEGSPSYPTGSTQSWTISDSQSTRKLLLLANPPFNAILTLENPLTLSVPATSGSEFPFAFDITSYNDSVNPNQPVSTTLVKGGDLTIHQIFENSNDAHTINTFLGNHTLTFENNVTLSELSYTNQWNVRSWMSALRVTDDKAVFEKDFTITNATYKHLSAPSNWLYLVELTYGYEVPDNIDASITFGRTADDHLTLSNTTFTSNSENTTHAGGIEVFAPEGLTSHYRIITHSAVNMSNLTLTASGEAALLYGIYNEGGTVITNGPVTLSQLTITPESTAEYQEVTGEMVINQGQIEHHDTVSITDLKGPGTVTAVQTYPGTVTFEKALTVKGLQGSETYSLYNINDANDTNVDSRITLMSAAHQIEGDMLAKREESESITAGDSHIEGTFSGSDAYFKGFTHQGSTGADASTIDLTFDNGARWEVVSSNPGTLGTTPTSTLNTLTLNGGHVYVGSTQTDFENPDILFASSNTHLGSTASPTTLQVNDLAGTGGHIYLRAYMQEDQYQTDNLVITGSATGEHQLHIKAGGHEPSETPEDIQANNFLIRVDNPANNHATFSLANTSYGPGIDLGLYVYRLADTPREGPNGLEWYLVRDNAPTPVDPTDPTDPTEPTTPTDPTTPTGPVSPEEPAHPTVPSRPAFSPSARALFSLAELSEHALLLTDMDTVRERHGNPWSEVSTGGWVKLTHQRMRSDTLASTRARLRVSTLTAGWDTRLADPRWIVGASLTASHGERRALNEPIATYGNLNQVAGNLYTTYVNDSGSYVNLQGTLSHLSQKIHTSMLDNTRVSGTQRSLGVGASLEMGHQFRLNSHVFLEPMMALHYAHIQGKDTSLDNGMRVEEARFDSLSARLALTAGYTWLRTGLPSGELWARVGLIHEFLGESQLTINRTRFTEDLLGTRYFFGLGADIPFSEHAKAYFMLERQMGSQLDETIGFNAGVRWTF